MESLNKTYSQTLKSILNLVSEPIAVKLQKEDITFPNNSKRMRYCQLLMEAKRGNTYTLTESNITCPAAAATLGFKPLPEKIRDGSMLQSMGLFESKEAASNIMKTMTRLDPNEIKAVIVSPLENADFMPDLVIVEDKPEKIMWLALAHAASFDLRGSFTTDLFVS